MDCCEKLIIFQNLGLVFSIEFLTVLFGKLFSKQNLEEKQKEK